MTNFDFQQTFNPEEYLYFYQTVLTQERSQKEIEFLVKHAELHQPVEILDLPCGHGRHANALAMLGHQITGIDLMKDFLDIAKEEATKLNVNVKYLHQDMRNIDYIQKFDRVFSLFTSIGYYDDDQNEQVFRKIFSALKPKGIFCFDSHNRDTFLTYCRSPSIVEKDNNFMIDQITFDSLSGRSNTKRTVIYNKSIKSFQYSVRFYNPTEITQLFTQIGFTEVEFYENWDGDPLTQNAKRMIVVAKKGMVQT